MTAPHSQKPLWYGVPLLYNQRNFIETTKWSHWGTGTVKSRRLCCCIPFLSPSPVPLASPPAQQPEQKGITWPWLPLGWGHAHAARVQFKPWWISLRVVLVLGSPTRLGPTVALLARMLVEGRMWAKPKTVTTCHLCSHDVALPRPPGAHTTVFHIPVFPLTGNLGPGAPHSTPHLGRCPPTALWPGPGKHAAAQTLPHDPLDECRADT